MMAYIRPLCAIFFLIKYAVMQDKYVDMQESYVNTKHYYVDMHESCNQIRTIKNSQKIQISATCDIQDAKVSLFMPT